MALFSAPQYRWLERFLRSTDLPADMRDHVVDELGLALAIQARRDGTNFDRDLFTSLCQPNGQTETFWKTY
jgi:hypothetical protein